MGYENDNQRRIAKRINSPRYTDSLWKDWKWQLQHTIRSIDNFEHFTGITFDPAQKERIRKVMEYFPLSITPYYLSLIDRKGFRNDPIFRQAFPDPEELNVEQTDLYDPLAEDKDQPVQGITHRYPDRVLFLVSNTCAMYCRHCTRKRKVGEIDSIPSKKQLEEGLKYIRKTPLVRDVLLSGGDPFLLSEEVLDWLLSSLSKIPHVEIIRIGTRIPVVLPYRVNDQLIGVLKKYKNVWVNTHFNHPREMTQAASAALAMISEAGIPLGNQTVLLAGVNDCPRIVKKLVHILVQHRVRPYYLYQCDLSRGISHFRTPIGKGIEIIENLIGHTTGFAVPRYVIDAPGGGGKIPVMPNYLISWSTNKVILRNYEGVITTYKEPDSYKPIFCNRKCDECKLQLNLDPAKEENAIGILRLMVDYDKTISLTPQDNVRLKRRKRNP